MKKFLVVFVMVFALVASASAQDVLEKGNYALGGSAGFSSMGGDLYENGAGDGQTSFSLSPSVQYFIMDNLSVGAGLNFSMSSQGDDKSRSMGLSPQVNYYFEQMGPGFPFARARFAFNSNHSEYKSSYVDPITNTLVETTVENDYSSTYIDVGAGYLYFLNEKVGVTGILNYSIDSSDGTSGGGINMSFGFRIFL